MQQALEAVVQARREDALLGHLEDGVDDGNDGVRRQRPEAARVHLVDQGELFVLEGIVGGAHAQGVDGQVALGVGRLGFGVFVAQSLVHIDELIAAQAGPGRDIVHDGGHGLGDAARMAGFVEVGDLGPALDHVFGAHRAAEAEDLAAGPLPAQLGVEAAADFIEPTGLFAGLVGQEGDQRRDQLGPQGGQEVGGQDALGHAAAGDGRNGVDVDVGAVALKSQGAGEADQSELGHGVVGLAEVAVEARGRRGHEDAAVFLLPQVGPGGHGHPLRPQHVDQIDQVPVLLAHLGEGLVAQDAGVVDDDVDTAEGIQRGLHDGGPIGHRIVVRDGLAASGLDLVDDDVGRAVAGTVARAAAAQVVDHDLGAARREEQRVGATQSVASARDDDDSVVEAKLLSHGSPL